MKILNKIEMEELLPDYVFGKLDSETKAIFEQNLCNYPEIKKEANDAIQVFSRFEDMDVDAILNRKTKNMSVRVHKKLDTRRKQSKLNFMKYALPIAASFALVFFLTNFNKERITTQAISLDTHKVKEYFTVKDTESIIDSATTYNELAVLSSEIQKIDINIPINEIIPDSKIANQATDRLIAEDFSDISGTELFQSSNNYYSVYSNIDDLDENTFQEILKEFKK